MPRIARAVRGGCPYHITHRGNRRGPVFFNDRDHSRYLRMLREQAEQARLQIWGYALMPNHVHLVAVPECPDSLARGIGNAHRRHSRAINHREGWTGHLWANRFYSTPLDEAHLWAAVRYVELNPVRSGAVRRAEEYRWSSARAHALGAADPLLDRRRPFPGPVKEWSKWLHAGIDDPHVEAIRRNTSTGRPTGSEAFVAAIECALGRLLRPDKRGPRRLGAVD